MRKLLQLSSVHIRSCIATLHGVVGKSFTRAFPTLLYAGLTEEERAARTGHANPNPEHKNADGTFQATQTMRVVGLDLDNTLGIQTLDKAQSGVSFDVDDSGFLKNTGWIAPGDGFLTLDRDLTGSVEKGSELFSNNLVDLSQRGINGLAWLDANGDGIINNLDPVFNQLKVWKDANHNGAIEDGERGLLSYYGITQLNYRFGTFTQNGQVKQMASTDLTADTQGTRATVVPEGILLQTSGGQITLIVTKIEDESHLNVNQDRISIVEDTTSVVTAADLTAIDNFRHGTASLDANGFIHFNPEANYNGTDAGFDYTTLSPNLQTGRARVNITFANVNDAPVITNVTHEQRAIYGWTGRVANDGMWEQVA